MAESQQRAGVLQWHSLAHKLLAVTHVSSVFAMPHVCLYCAKGLYFNALAYLCVLFQGIVHKRMLNSLGVVCVFAYKVHSLLLRNAWRNFWLCFSKPFLLQVVVFSFYFWHLEGEKSTCYHYVLLLEDFGSLLSNYSVISY